MAAQEEGDSSSRLDVAKQKSDLHSASRAGDVETVKHLLNTANSASLINKRDKLSRAPIHLAAFGGSPDVIQLLLQNGADVDATAMDGMTALHFAAQAGHLQCVELLLGESANVNAVVSKGRKTALHLACTKGYLDISLCLIRNDADTALKNSKKELAIDLFGQPEGKEQLIEAARQFQMKRKRHRKQKREQMEQETKRDE